MDIDLLRRAAWADENGLAAGMQIDMDIVELGAAGIADVLSVLPCPNIGPRPAAGCRVVTVTYAHLSAQTFDLTVAGVNGQPDETIGVTANHPIWSQDEQGFVAAGDLLPDETMLTATGDATRVISVLPRPGPEPVYNLEVDVERVYYVWSSGVLAHNMCARGDHLPRSKYQNYRLATNVGTAKRPVWRTYYHGYTRPGVKATQILGWDARTIGRDG